MTALLLATLLLLAAWLPVQAQDITSNLVGHWRFNEGTGGNGATLTDSSSTAAHGTLVVSSGTPVWGSDNRGGGSLGFSTATMYMNVPDNSAFDFGTGNFTVAVWVKGVFDAYVVCKDNVVGDGNGLYIYRRANNLYHYWNGSTDIAFVPSTTDTNWHHLVAVRSGTGTNQVQLYSDNVAGATLTDARTFANSLPLRVFFCADTAQTGFTATVGNLRIYNRALNASEVSALYNASDAPDGVQVKRRPLVLE